MANIRRNVVLLGFAILLCLLPVRGGAHFLPDGGLPAQPTPKLVESHGRATSIGPSAQVKSHMTTKIGNMGNDHSLGKMPVPSNGCPVKVPRDDWAHIIHKAVQRYFNWGNQHAAECKVRALIRAESHWRPLVCSPVHACGLGQIMPKTAEHLGVKDVFDPEENLKGAVQYYAWNTRQFSHAHHRTFDQQAQNGAASYNGGLGRLLHWQREHGCNNWPCFVVYAPKETKDYVWRIEQYSRTGKWIPHPPKQYLSGDWKTIDELVEDES